MRQQRARASERVAGLVLCLLALSAQVIAVGAVPGERRLLEKVVQRSGARAAEVAGLVDQGTSNGPLAVLTAVLVAVLVRHGRARAALAVGVCVFGALVTNPLLKWLVDRPRPEQLSSLEGASALSFPSGHAAGTAAAAVAAVLVATGARRRPAVVLAVVLATVLVVVTAAAQLALARHHPSDVVAGWLWGAAWTTAVWARLGPPAQSGRGAGRPPGGRMPG